MNSLFGRNQASKLRRGERYIRPLYNPLPLGYSINTPGLKISQITVQLEMCLLHTDNFR